MARDEALHDQRAGLGEDPGVGRSVAAAVEWLGVAQDRSHSADGGVARHFSLVSGWAPSYPETTGYIIPTLLDRAATLSDAVLESRASRMLDWLVSIQLPGGGFQGGMIGQTPVMPTVFNTGQILLGLAAGTRSLSDAYRAPMRAAADWLVATQDADGCWRKNASPFARKGDKVYDTHVSWGLLEASRVDHSAAYADAALRNVDWALTKQLPNGWFSDNCLDDPTRPLTHTIGYALRGVLEAYRFSGTARYLDASRRCAEGLMTALKPDGRLPGRLDSNWTPGASWVCLTGSAQIAHCWLLLYRETGEEKFRDAAFNANEFVRRTMQITGDPNIVGGVKGSFPISGSYGRFEYLNWACKFVIDSNLLERQVRESDGNR